MSAERGEVCDFAVIGAGAAGSAAAKCAAGRGATVLLIEDEKVGGTCLNCGCVPTKYFLSRPDSGRGELESLIAGLGSELTAELERAGVKILAGRASFAEDGSLYVQTAKGRIAIEARFVLVATGCRDFMPAFAPKSPAVTDTRGFLALEELPPSVAVIGGGVAGCELATICAAAQNVDTVLLEAADEILSGFDPRAAAMVRTNLERKGTVKIKTSSALRALQVTEEGTVVVRYEGGEAEVDLAVCAMGRVPNTDALGLNHLTGVVLDERGFVETDENGKTGWAKLYAAGDIVKGAVHNFAEARLSGLRVANALFPAPAASSLRFPPIAQVVFSEPPIATVGRGVADGTRYGEVVCPMSMNLMAQLKGRSEGFVKLVYDRKSLKLAGATAVGAGAEELILPMAAALQAEAGLEYLAYGLFPHPVRGEIWSRAAEIALGLK